MFVYGDACTSACRNTFVEVSGTCRSPGLASQLAPGILFPPSVLWWLPCPSGFDVRSGALTFIFVQHALHPLSHLTSLGRIFKSSLMSIKCRMELLGTLISLGALLWTTSLSHMPYYPLLHWALPSWLLHLTHRPRGQGSLADSTVTQVGDDWSLTLYL